MIFQSKKQEHGAIMLEVIAVLALMGVMGAMLFRQIYLRNQELHNVQMASEMRTVKEAFSAALQARAQEVLNGCAGVVSHLAPNDVGVCPDFNMQSHVKEYLPDGWFPDNGGADGSELANYYTLHTFVYKQNDSSQKVKIYGMVIPKSETLPATGWNFKRAARVSLLIGADGGVYGSVTGDDIQGSLGTWSLSASDVSGSLPKDDHDNNIPTYVAITGLDVFTPEYDIPEGKVNFKQDWDLQLNKLNVYKLFTVGGDGTSCFDNAYIKHNVTTVNGSGETQAENDTVQDVTLPAGCLPSFWVDPKSDGNVSVRNALNVGYDKDASTAAAPVWGVRITKEGAILFKDTVKDLQDPSKEDKSYLLDPAYTSIMNDVKLMSRGGALLSDILPNYILKTQKELSSSTVTAGQQYSEVVKPTCPAGYTKALVILPTSWDKKNMTVSGLKTVAKPNVDLGADPTKADIPALDVTSGNFSNEAGICVKIGSTLTSIATDTAAWQVTLGRRNGSNCDYDNTVKAIAQTYCVFDINLSYPTKDKCEAAGYVWTTACTEQKANPKGVIRSNTAANQKIATTKAECQALGGTWDNAAKTCTIS